MGVEPPFIYDRPSTYTFGSPTDRAFNPKAATHASWTPKPPKPKQDGPLVDFNKHPDSYIVVPYGNLNATPMPPNTHKKIVRVRYVQLFLRVCALIGALGSLFCVIAINKTTATVGWIIRAAPAVAILHTVYAVFHLARAPTSRTPASTASYMIFAAMVDTGLIPFWVFCAWVAQADYSRNEYGWSTLFNDSDLSYKIINAFFLLSCVEGGLMVVSLFLDIYLGVKFRQISKLPPDMNPLEANLTSRHKRNKSGITEKNMRSSALTAKRESQVSGFKRIPFIHTRTDSADSVTLYGGDSARNSRVEFRKELDENEKDPWRWSRNSSPERPGSAVNPSPNSRSAGSGLDFRPERSSMLKEKPSRPSSWLSYLDYEGVPSTMSEEASAELDHEVRPISPVSAISAVDITSDKIHRERENWYHGSPARNSQVHLPPRANNSQINIHSNNTSKSNLHQSLPMPSPESPPRKRSREPLGMNPPTPKRSSFNDENAFVTPVKDSRIQHDGNRAALHDADGNAQGPLRGTPANSRPSSFVGSGGKARFYGDLRQSIGTVSPSHEETNKKADIQVSINEVQDMYERTRTMQTESDYSANFEVYSTSDDEGEGRLSANITNVQAASPSQWNGARQTSNSTGFDMNSGYAGLGAEFGKGMGRRRDVSGKVAEEGRASPTRNGAAGWERFKGL
ncbi:uncharacterized protein Z520_06725 [Fonsecaea multimorphosa CBS 102226]|uniref:Uncharacterized protein n=1 Tax=Fonsecaea multimorphosa CBS 102226 TaxID=1442371 RepID=A0A0D2KKY0_9EURO|nr:uncharacterized protein Z520_06725 [Fonsecaea multimorphosa CBS 102226]KIX97273.1 hypothetical protein Z520_06725 [Fonsecaea multimorphosa CBS 102226]OAL23241.1 hypothetical protein AYO22_06291 [Fonsecaea multimorphosa]